MFKQDYKNANDGIHAGDALLDRIRAEQGKNRTPVRTAWWAAGGTVAAAAIVLIAVFAFSPAKGADLAAPMSAEASVESAAGEKMIAYDTTAAGAEAAACDMVAEEACADGAGVEMSLNMGVPVVLYEDVDLGCAMDDWFVALQGDSSLIAAERTDGAWRSTGPFPLPLAAHTVLTDDDRVIAISDDGGDTRAFVFELRTDGDVTLYPISEIMQSGSYVDAVLENDVLYMLTAAEDGLTVGAADTKAPEQWQILQQLDAPYEDASLFETNDGVLVVCKDGSDSILTVLYNEPDGFAVDATGTVTGTLLYAYRTQDATWHTVSSVDDQLIERILDDAFSILSEQEMRLSADLIYFDDEELLACTYPQGNDVLHVERYAASDTAYYAATGEVWETDGSAYIGEIVSWDDDSDTVYTFDGIQLFAFDVHSGTVKTIVTLPTA